MDYKKMLTTIEDFVREEGDYVHDHWAKTEVDSTHDSGADVSTNFDKRIEERFRKLVDSKYPDMGVCGEEGETLRADAKYTWYIDPIDGTKYFYKGVPLWAVTVALMKNGNPVLGVIYNPVTKKMYSAVENCGATVNNKTMKLPKPKANRKTQIAFDATYPKIDGESREGDIDWINKVFAELNKHFYRVRILGNCTLSLSWVARGMFGGFIHTNIHTEKQRIEIAAGELIAREAGAKTKHEKRDTGKAMVVGSDLVVDTVSKILRDLS